MRRIIQVGVGGMGGTWTERVAASKRWEAAAYVDVNRKNLIAAAARHGMPKSRCFTDLEEALRHTEADALLDVTPQQFRRKVCTAALRRGLHVLCEKPLADSLRNAVALVETAAKEKRVLMVAQNYRYQVGAQTVKQFLHSGKLGTLGYIGVSFHKGPHFGGFREQMAYPLVLDMSIHHFDLMRLFVGKDVRAVQAASINAPWNWNKGDATVMTQLEFIGGVVVNYFGSWVSQGAETSWNGDWRFEGSNGVLLWRQDGVFFSDKGTEMTPVPLVDFPVEHQAYLLEAFADALDSGKEPETSGKRNLNSLATTYAVVKAARERRRVQVTELIK
ncbi:MAG TPA: Gfo/Idh/MocA family oxidoreductase [Candidatus Hydrogenedentes bacterium]|nr:Gfo/Idh/MocA family oxidoreductase [Candidatus Hydrogenedentota bacterium]HOL76415.1 Gfo/Idh/MocA family oxidoreductase [Candidatus Hydrogenedentota bacterium]HPO85453.1 Gfo/Idh/MocA family oxidoreductase [Candidatus Hydrogenedentota bacterium]